MNSYDVSRPGRLVTCYSFPGSPPFICIGTDNRKRFHRLAVEAQSGGNRVDPTYHQYFTQTENFWSGQQYLNDGSFISDSTGNWDFGTPPPPSEDLEDYLRQSCLIRTYEKLRGNIDLAVEMAQAGQTSGMVRGATKAVDFAGDLYQSVRAGRPVGRIGSFLNGTHRRFDRTKTTGELWLEYQYGWRPFVQTVFDCADQIVKPSMSDRWPLLVIKERDRVLSKINVTRENSYFAPFSEHIVGATEHRGEMMTQWRIPPSRLLDYAQWTSFNPSGIVWELLPFSFVVDWFVNVGGYLRALESAFLYKAAYVRGYYTYTRQISYRSNISEQIGFSRVTVECDKVQRNKKRIVMLDALPRAPVFKPKLGWQRLLSTAGLLAGFLGDKHPGRRL